VRRQQGNGLLQRFYGNLSDLEPDSLDCMVIPSDRSVILHFQISMGSSIGKSSLEAGMVAPCRRAAIVPADEAPSHLPHCFA